MERFIYTRKTQYLGYILVLSICVLIGSIMEAIIGEKYILAFMILCGETVYCLFLSFDHAGRFQQTIVLGRTRKEYLLATGISVALRNGCTVLAVILCSGIREIHIDGQTILSVPDIIKCACTYVVVMCAMELCVGAMYLRYSRKAMITFMIVWMLLCYLPGLIINSMKEHPQSLLAKLGRFLAGLNYSVPMVLGCALVFAAVISTLGIVSVMRQDANS